MLNINWSKPSLSRDFALLSTVVLCLLVITSAVVTYDTYEVHAEKTIEQLGTEATRIDRALILEVEHASYLVESLGRQISYRGTEDLKSIAQLLRSFDTIATRHHVFSWIGPEQKLLISSNKGVLRQPVDVSDRDYMKKSIMEPWKIQIGRPIEGRVSEKWVLPVALGVTDETGEYIGTILISMDIHELTQEMAAATKKSGVSFAIMSQTFITLTQRSEERDFINQFPLPLLQSIDFKSQPSGILSQGSLLDWNSPYVIYETSTTYPYIILLGLSADKSNLTVIDLLLPRLLQLMLMAVFLVSLLWFIRLRLIVPIEKLTEITGAIARGELFRPLPKSGPTEIEELSAQIRKASDYIAERQRIEEEQRGKIITLKRAKETAEQSNRIKVEFLTAMSHELRTPLNTITGFAEMMEKETHGPIDNPQYKQYVENIHQSSLHLESLISDVLALSKAETGLLEIQEKPIDVRFVANKCVRVLSDRMNQAGISIDVRLPETLPHLVVDELRLKQIIVNLLTNAIRHTMPGGNITLEAQIEQDQRGAASFALMVTDFRSQNHAVSSTPVWTKKDESQHKIKSDIADTANLSIPLTKALVAMHQGTLTIESVPGKHTRIIVRFPKERIVR